ncbi:MAG: UDP-galactopyranose mutase [Usitatibacteraceae bacterium]
MLRSKYSYLIVGAGFTGATLAERLASQCDKKVLVIDKRSHIAGNAYDTRNEHGILFHQYGPHIFHTNSAIVVDYLSKFTDWMPYEHRVVGAIDGRMVPIPFNLTSLEILFPGVDSLHIKKLLIETFGMDKKVPILKMLDSEHQGVRDLASFIYENVFSGYTKKQWGLKPEELSPSVTARVPVHVSYDDRYFQDSFQKMPREGYTRMFERVLAHPNISVSLNTAFEDVCHCVQYENLVFTGAIDEYFKFELGELPYRSLTFEFQTYRLRRHQAVAQVNYPISKDYTRISEMAHFTQEWGDRTTVAIEYPRAHVSGKTVPYYPIPRSENTELHHRYLDFAKKEAPNVIFAGRLGDYQYYNMDQAVAGALTIFNRIRKS